MKKSNSVWDYDLLWSKCQVYAEKALNEPRESPMFPFWSALVIEFLGRATLAKIHPVLLADPREGDNILYVFGFSKAEGPPKSIVSKTVFDRCSKIIPDFTKKEIDSCLKLIDRRNEELHSGSAAFVDFPTSSWLADYYNACKILLTFNKLKLRDLFNPAEEKVAKEMIRKVDAAVLADVNKRIATYKTTFTKLAEKEKTIRRKNGDIKSSENLKSGAKQANCMCCSAKGLVSGKTVFVSEERLVDGEIIYEKIILPTKFICFSCGIKLNGHQELAIAGLGGQFSEEVIWDPAEYHGIETYEPDLSDYYDYGND